jgi:hypothetical protein
MTVTETVRDTPDDAAFEAVQAMADHEVWWKVDQMRRRLDRGSETVLWHVAADAADLLVDAVDVQTEAQEAYEAAVAEAEAGGADAGIYELEVSAGYMRAVRWALVRYLRKKAALDRQAAYKPARPKRRRL